MKTQFLLLTLQHIYKCRTIEEIALAVFMQLVTIAFQAVAVQLSAFGKFFEIHNKGFVIRTKPASPSAHL
jgi:high-affinity K+ transport system ATPase subunit B